MSGQTYGCLDGPVDVPMAPQTERAGSPRTALCVGYRPPLDYASAVAAAVSKYGITCMRLGADCASAAAWDAKSEAFEAVLDLLYGPRPTDDEERDDE